MAVLAVGLSAPAAGAIVAAANVRDGRKGVDDRNRQVQGYASATSVRPGESIKFHVTVNPAQDVRVSIYRLGWYNGTGSRRLQTGPWLPGTPQPVPAPDPVTGLISCSWPVSWTLEVPHNWSSGLYQAVFTSASGWRSSTPFVVRDDERVGGLCVVLPFTTYQAYNQWPMDKRIGKSLYYGYSPGERTDSSLRAVQVSFDRPYPGNGRPKHMDRDHHFIQWAERNGYDLTYATSQDLHAGRVDPARYRGLIFPGHDEYWSHEMRRAADRAVSAGSSLAFLAANNVYWHVRIRPSGDGQPDRIMSCYKNWPDPHPETPGPTGLWRNLADGNLAEQGLLGVQYNGIVAKPAPLVVHSPDHWIWTGAGVTASATIPNLVGGEADGVFPDYPHPEAVTSATLSASPYRLKSGEQRTQNTHIYETNSGGLVFDAGTLFWTRALNEPDRRDPRIERATANLLDRMLCQKKLL